MPTPAGRGWPGAARRRGRRLRARRGARQTGAGRAPPRRASAVAVPVRRPAALSVRRAARLGRAHAADARGRRGALRPARRDDRRRPARPLRQDGQRCQACLSGGPALARLAAFGDAGAFDLPRPLMHSDDLDFSFSGLKTAVMTALRRIGSNVCEQDRANLAAATQEAIVDDVLVHKVARRAGGGAWTVWSVAGGVGANARPRERLTPVARRGARALSRTRAVHRQRRDDRSAASDAFATRQRRPSARLRLRHAAALAARGQLTGCGSRRPACAWRSASARRSRRRPRLRVVDLGGKDHAAPVRLMSRSREDANGPRRCPRRREGSTRRPSDPRSVTWSCSFETPGRSRTTV